MGTGLSFQHSLLSAEPVEEQVWGELDLWVGIAPQYKYYRATDSRGETGMPGMISTSAVILGSRT